MGFDYFVFYTEASMVCVFILSIILITDRIYNTMQEKQIWFRRAIVLFMMYFISDGFWAAILSEQIPKIRPLVVLFNLSNFILLGLMAYGLFMFMAASEKMDFRNDIKMKRLCLLPIVISLGIMVVLYIVDPLFWINEANELNRMYYPLMFLAPFFYLFAGFILSVRCAIRAQSRAERRQCLMLGSIPLAVMAFGMLQVIILNAPTFCFGCTVMWLFYYIQNMQTLISVDELTHLNNRGQINRFLEQIRYSEDTKVYIMMIDINRFKKINDTYGHAEGDHALIIVSDALRMVCEEIRSFVFIGRYGGDEFTIIMKNPEEEDRPEELTEKIRTIIAGLREQNHLSYELAVSIGYDELLSDSDTVYACMDRADRKLYIDKGKALL